MNNLFLILLDYMQLYVNMTYAIYRLFGIGMCP